MIFLFSCSFFHLVWHVPETCSSSITEKGPQQLDTLVVTGSQPLSYRTVRVTWPIPLIVSQDHWLSQRVHASDANSLVCLFCFNLCTDLILMPTPSAHKEISCFFQLSTLKRFAYFCWSCKYACCCFNLFQQRKSPATHESLKKSSQISKNTCWTSFCCMSL